jgi:hypothetical protein
MLPRRFATEEAGSIESAVMKLVMKNRVPSLLSEILNLSWKKNVIQELGNISWDIYYCMERTETNSGARELAKESSANRMHNLMTVILLLRLKVTSFQNGKVFFFCGESSVSDSSDGVSESVVGSGVFSISQFLLNAKMKQSIIPPNAEYAQKTALYALMMSHPKPLTR